MVKGGEGKGEDAIAEHSDQYVEVLKALRKQLKFSEGI
jgi:hypothetical protein